MRRTNAIPRAARVRRPRNRFPTRRLIASLAAAAALLAVLPGDGLARQPQGGEPFIFIIEPADWRLERGLSAGAGQSVMVRGKAFHPGGVARVLVDGEAAELAPDPAAEGVMDFERVFVARAGLEQVAIVVEPPAGARYVETFQIMVAAPEAPPAAAAPAPASPPGPNPWRGVGIRSVGYGAAAAAGALLAVREASDSYEFCEPRGAGQDCWLRTETSKPQRTVGAALIVGALAAGAVDAALASRAGRGGGRLDSRAGPGAGEVRGFRLRISWAPSPFSPAGQLRLGFTRRQP